MKELSADEISIVSGGHGDLVSRLVMDRTGKELPSNGNIPTVPSEAIHGGNEKFL